jgi:hypothetical protein
MADPATGRFCPRRVDVRGPEYAAARARMCAIEPADLEDPDARAALARAGNCSEDAIAAQFARAARGLFGSRRLSEEPGS